MENHQLILNSNSLCIFCLNEVKVNAWKNDPFPLHHLTSKLGIDLGNVFQDMIVPGVPHPLLNRMEILIDTCEGCAHLCGELLYKFQEDVETENCSKLILDKMEKVGLEDKYKKCESPLAIFYSGIVDRLRKEIIEKLRLIPELKSKSETETRARNIPKIVDIPGLPFDQICSYLPLKDIKTCSTVSKDLRRLVFPSLINSSFVSFENQTQLPAMIDFIKTKSNNFKNVNLFVKSKSFDDSSNGRSALLQLFEECGSHIKHLKLSYGLASYGLDVVNGFRDNYSIPVLGNGNELLPSLKKLELEYLDEEYGDDEEDNGDLEKDCREKQIKASLPFIKAVLENSPVLKELKLWCYYYNCFKLRIPYLFKLIGESAQKIDTLKISQVPITDDDLGYLKSLNLKKLIFYGDFDLGVSQALTNFLESQRKSLKKLQLLSEVPFPYFTFPRMESLESFTFKPWDRIENTANLGKASFHTQLPILKEFELDLKEDCFPTLFLLNSEPSESVKVLRLPSSKYEKHNLTRAVCAFKCLSKLEIPVSSYLDNCWKDLKSLEELTLHSIQDPDREKKMLWIQKLNFLDRIITGLHVLRRCSNTTEQDIREYEEKYEKMETKKSLALLTKLRLLRLCREDRHSNTFDQSLNLSDISCRLVLMKMESLKCIEFCGYRPAFVGASKKVLNEMGNKMDLCFSGKPAKLELLGWDLKFK